MSEITSSYYENIVIEELKKRFSVSRETIDKFKSFYEILIKWNEKINLIGKKTEGEIWHRHILDSAQLSKFIKKDGLEILDIGSGAGFPAIILAIMSKNKIHLVESDSRKCAFLNQAKAILNLNIQVHNKRIESFKEFKIDVITARAFSSIKNILQFSQFFLNDNNFCLLLKGESVVQEIEEAKLVFNFNYELFDSVTNSQSKIIKIKVF